MSNLVLELRQGETMIVNGASIRFRTKTRLELTARARFLFGKQIMPPNGANTPARRIYYALQSAYIGPPEERSVGLRQAERLIGEFKTATTSALARQILDRALDAARADDCYEALKLTRRIIRHEDSVLAAVEENRRCSGANSRILTLQDCVMPLPERTGRAEVLEPVPLS